MNREIRHPYHITETSELVIGQDYTFISDAPLGTREYSYTFGGIIVDSGNAKSTVDVNHFVVPFSAGYDILTGI